ncbi:hypothetical protein CV945_08850 [Geobacillus sp. Manikaran-105]|uniref:hypothetical protein n=1 Tax=Geobacillus sp. Manikaran-105 TaxID=2055940 RepID=UPI000C28525E|nr:hypothetical protein [Geobacillus sp. Manikaran-105]PJW14399.1 hypothetical protein CV945_08850 [Geobacillus sp. Manikaran-105]
MKKRTGESIFSAWGGKKRTGESVFFAWGGVPPFFCSSRRMEEKNPNLIIMFQKEWALFSPFFSTFMKSMANGGNLYDPSFRQTN